MTWTWRLQPEPTGSAPAVESFSNQGDAESWIGTTWRELAEAGVATVTLMNDDASVYEMPLSAD